LCDAFQVPKPLSLQLLLFGKSDADLGELTFGVVRFLLCLHLADGLRGPGGQSTPSQFVTVFFVFLPRFYLIWFCFRFSLQPVCGRSEAHADGPPGLRGRSVFLGSVLVVLFALTDGPRIRPNNPQQGCGQSVVPCRTVRAAIADSPPCLAGRSA
jgi:hypothetical protein